MSRAADKKIYADFSQGFVSDYNKLSIPDGAVKDLTNFDINKDGTVQKRPGLWFSGDRNTIGSWIPNDQTEEYVKEQARATISYVWKNVNGVPGLDVLVLAVGNRFYLFYITDEGPVGDYRIIGSSLAAGSYATDITDINGHLVVANEKGLPFVITLNDAATGEPLDFVDTSYTNIDVRFRQFRPKVRDMDLWWGGDEASSGLYIQSELTAEHDYNLRNSGWPVNSNIACTADDGATPTITYEDPVVFMRQNKDAYPSITVPYFLGRHGIGENIEAINAFNPNRLDNLMKDTNENNSYNFEKGSKNSFFAGKNIVNPLNFSRVGIARDASTNVVETVQEKIVDVGNNGYRCIENFAGRIFLSGVSEEGLGSNIYFSTIFNQNIVEDLSACYQLNDPTSELQNELLPSDGGVISIKGAGQIKRLVEYQGTLLVFALNGVWVVSGGERGYFTADDYAVTKISNKSALSLKAISPGSDTVYFLSSESLNIVTLNRNTGFPEVQDVSSGKIKKFYNNIPFRSKQKAFLSYNPNFDKLYIYYEQDFEGREEVKELVYNRCLIFDAELGAFTKYHLPLHESFSEGDPFVNDQEALTFPVYSINFDKDYTQRQASLYSDILSSANENVIVFTVSSNIPQVGGIEFAIRPTFLKFINFEEGYDEQRDDYFLGYRDLSGEYTAEIDVGFDSFGDILDKAKKTPILVAHFDRTETGFIEDEDDPGNLRHENQSSCLFSYKWDWGNHYSEPVELYKYKRNYIPQDENDPLDYDRDVISTRHRVRGKGYSFGTKLVSPENRDCRLLGYGLVFTLREDRV